MRNLFKHILSLLFPERCMLCRRILPNDVMDICHDCRIHAPIYPFSMWNTPDGRKRQFPFLDSFTAVWYYEGDVRKSLLRFKFRHATYLAPQYGRMLAMKIEQSIPDSIDYLTWVPISRIRRFTRGYDQAHLIAQSVGRELGIQPVPLLIKMRNNKKQSTIHTQESRRANVLGVYRFSGNTDITGKTILLIDDILTTGATAQECAKILLTAGAKEVHCAAVAAAHKTQNKPRR